MESCVHIGNNIDNKAGEVLSKLIASVFENGAKFHMSESVVMKALDLIHTAYQVNDTTIQNCTFTAGK